MTANIKSLNARHDKLTQMFTRYLERHLSAQDVVDDVMHEIDEPSPAMLAVIAKFLKDNDVSATPEAIDSLHGMRRSLEEKRKNRVKTLADLDIMPPGSA